MWVSSSETSEDSFIPRLKTGVFSCFLRIKERIDVIPEEEIQTYLPKAREIMTHIDLDDVPFIALALSIKPDGIWTEDNDFFEQNEIRIYRTTDMLKFMDYHVRID